METNSSQYLSLCSEFLRGDYGNTLPQAAVLNFQLLQELPPSTVTKLQIQALKDVLSEYIPDTQCLDRFGILTDTLHESCNNLSKPVGYLNRQTKQPEKNKINLSPLIKYMEESNYLINKLAEITEDLDNQVSKLHPYKKQLLKLQQISHTIIENADFGILVADRYHKIIMFNKAGSNILSISQRILGSTLEQVFVEPNLAFVLKAFSEQCASPVEAKIQGTTKVLDIRSQVFWGKKGERDGTVVFIHDITSKEKEKKVLEENIKLATVGKLAAGVAHEIKNPLTVIKGFSQLLLKKRYADPTVLNFLEIIAAETDRANMFIQDFLNLGRQRKPSKKLINIRNIVEEAIALIESQCFLNNIEIIKKLDCSCELFADPDQIKQVLVNLAKNSVEAMEGDLSIKRLTVHIFKNTEDQTLSISLSDTGCGIPDEMIDKVTTSFFTTKKFGTGLGLNISKTIIEQHGGRLQFFSDKKGTTATIQLPLNGSDMA